MGSVGSEGLRAGGVEGWNSAMRRGGGGGREGGEDKGRREGEGAVEEMSGGEMNGGDEEVR